MMVARKRKVISNFLGQAVLDELGSDRGLEEDGDQMIVAVIVPELG